MPQWELRISSVHASASLDYSAGTPGARVTVSQAPRLDYQLSLVQSALLLCEAYRYRVSATLRSVTAGGWAVLTVTGGAANNFTGLLPAALQTALGPDAVTLTAEFEVARRWDAAEVAVLLGTMANDGAVIDVESVSLCPVPSKAQYCEAGPRQTPATRIEALTSGATRVTAINQVCDQGPKSTAHFRQLRRFVLLIRWGFGGT